MKLHILGIAGTFMGGLALGLGLRIVAQGVDFNHDVRPILAEKCFQCHGADEAAR